MSGTSSDPRPCKLCGMRVIFRPGPNGRAIPLQRIRSAYTMNAGRQRATRLQVTPALELYVNHFETCPHAERFRSRAREADPEPKT